MLSPAAAYGVDILHSRSAEVAAATMCVCSTVSITGADDEMFQGFPRHNSRGFNISHPSGHRCAGRSGYLHDYGGSGMACIRVSLWLLCVHGPNQPLITIEIIEFFGPLCAMETECEPGVPILDIRLQQTTSILEDAVGFDVAARCQPNGDIQPGPAGTCCRILPRNT